jgi:hypothetical protein
VSPATYARLDEIRRREALAAAARIHRAAEAAPPRPATRARTAPANWGSLARVIRSLRRVLRPAHA